MLRVHPHRWLIALLVLAFALAPLSMVSAAPALPDTCHPANDDVGACVEICCTPCAHCFLAAPPADALVTMNLPAVLVARITRLHPRPDPTPLQRPPQAD